ncbi:uncharacterized protein [Rhodnius prolixus]|uniref:Uncharacterized protein n=3 Tax=Rhodnius TaxID=13248 RepID=A0ABL0E9Z5_RHOPR
MVKDVPIPKEIYREFQPFVENKESLAKLFDDFIVGVSGDETEIEKEMPSHNKGQNCLDKYFSKVNIKDNENKLGEMGKKNTKFNDVHEISNSSASEAEMSSTLNTVVESNKVYESKDLDDTNCKENIEFERLPSKPIIAAMNALGKLKRGISELNVDDNSSRDSTALVIDEEQLEYEKDSTVTSEEPLQSKGSSRKANNDQTSPKEPGNRSLSGKSGPNKNDSLTISQFFNTTKSTSTPVDSSKGTKRKRSESTSEQSHSKKSKEKNVHKTSEAGFESYENMENLTEVNPLRDGSCPLALEDLDSEDEIYVVQCPKEVELESLVGKQIELNGESTLKLQVNGEIRPFDCFSQKDSMERHVNIILPSKIDGAFKFGIHQLNGSVLISEGMDAPHTVSSDDEGSLKNVAYKDLENKHSELNKFQTAHFQKNKKLKKREIQTADADDTEEGGGSSPKGASSHENNSSGSVKKKKKKKDKDEEKLNDEETNLEFEKPSKKIRKEKVEELLIVQEQGEVTGDEKPIKKKKRKKHHGEGEQTTSEIEMEHVGPVEVIDEELLMQEDNPIKKKKKKKHKERTDEAEPVPDPIVTEDLPVKKMTEDLPVKKKKKKYQEQELVPSIKIEDDTSTKKKQKHLTEGSTGDVEEIPSHLKLSSFIETEVQSLKKKKKKKKKKEKDTSPD